MLCDICKKNQASGKVTVIRNGVREVKNICRQCSQKSNLGGGSFGRGGGLNDLFGGLFGDIFGDIFGGGGRSRGRRHASGQPGAHLRYELTVSLEEAVYGATRQIKISTLAKCKTCDGSGAKKGSKPIKCSECEGAGQISVQQGFFSIH